jgi:hypothetical protein
LRLLHIQELDESLLKFAPLTDLELHDYKNRSVGCICITADNFRLDMSRPRHIPFNVEACDVFTLDFLSKIKNNGWYKKYSIPESYLTIKHVSTSLHEHLKYVFQLYRDLSLPDTEEVRRLRKSHLKKVSRSSRKGQVGIFVHS